MGIGYSLLQRIFGRLVAHGLARGGLEIGAAVDRFGKRKLVAEDVPGL
jgi:hypothetical protein